MKIEKLCFKAGKVGFLLCVALLGTLSGCITYVDRPRPSSVYVAPAAVEIDDYVYYPGYDVYYSSNRRQYLCLERGAWVSRPAPRGVSVDVLLASPSVRMDFHDSPAHHHAEVVRQYPRNWAPPNSNRGQKEKDDKRDERREK